MTQCIESNIQCLKSNVRKEDERNTEEKKE